MPNRPSRLYSEATGISAICSGTTMSATIRTNTASRPRQLRNTMAYAASEAMITTSDGRGTVMIAVVSSASGMPPVLRMFA